MEQAASLESPRAGWRETVRRVLAPVDRALDVAVISLLVAMVGIVFTSVITRYVLNFVFPWSEEITLLCLTWFSFVGIAIGFREKVHLAMDIVSGFLSERANRWLTKFIDVCIFSFGVYLLVFGTQFAMRMRFSTLSATGLPNSVQYVVMPITGALTCLYSALQLLGVQTERYLHIDEEIKRDEH